MSKDPKPAESKPEEPKAPGTAVVNWRERMTAIQTQAAQMEQPKGGFLSFKGGRLSYNEELIPGDKLNVIVVDFVLENGIYKEKYNPNKPATPMCYALGRIEEEMAPHADSPEPQHIGCVDCPNNEWGSDPEGGRGKACKNSRRIAVIPADVLKGGAEAIKKVQPVLCKLPVTSLKAFSTFINQIVKVLNTTPFAVVAELSVTPSANQFQVNWKILDKVEDETLLSALYSKYEATQKMLWAPYPKLDDEPAAKQSTKY